MDNNHKIMSKKHIEKKGLTDKELIAKYDTGEKVDFDKTLREMVKRQSDFSQKKSHIPKR